jgi:hypothetical protein
MNRRKLNQIRESFEVNEKKVFEEFESLQVIKQTKLVLARTEQLNHLFLGCSVFLSNGRFKETAAMLLKIKKEIEELEQEDVLGEELIKHLKNHLEKKIQEFVMVSKEKFYKLIFGFCSLIADEQANQERWKEKNRGKEKPEEIEEDQDSERLKTAKMFFENIFLQIETKKKKIENENEEEEEGKEEVKNQKERQMLINLLLKQERLMSYSNLCMDVELFQAVKVEALDDEKESLNKNPDLTLIRLLEAFRMFGDSSIPQDIKINMNMRLHKTLISFLQYFSGECELKSHLLLGNELINQTKGLSLQINNPILNKFSFMIHCNVNQRQINGLIEAFLILILGICQKICWMTQFLDSKLLNLKRIFEQFFGFSLKVIFSQLFSDSRRKKKKENTMFADDHKHQERTNEEMIADWRVISKISKQLGITRANLIGVMPCLQMVLDQFLANTENFFKDHVLTVALLNFHQTFLNTLHKMALEEMNMHYLTFVYKEEPVTLDIISLEVQSKKTSKK